MCWVTSFGGLACMRSAFWKSGGEFLCFAGGDALADGRRSLEGYICDRHLIRPPKLQNQTDENRQESGIRAD